jgi:gamma-glutamyl-gamma-aminobutyrate hydrolase PuuD
MMTVKGLLTSGVSTCVDGKHWEPAISISEPLIWRIRDAWEVLMGRAAAIKQTPITKDE